MTQQPGILQDVPAHGRYITMQLRAGVSASQLTACLQDMAVFAQKQNIELGTHLVVGLGSTTVQTLKAESSLESLAFVECPKDAVQVPSTPAALWLWFRSEEAGQTLLWSQASMPVLQTCFELENLVDGFKFKEGRDLTGYEDGTENPEGADAEQAAFVQGSDVSGLNGSSYVAVQQWQHNLAHFKSLPQNHQDDIIGRRLSDNVEFKGSPITAHVKRTAQESFTPMAFMLRRSMPYKQDMDAGLMFVCFASSPLPFAQQLTRMIGAEDGKPDALFEFSRPLTGAYYWCPSMKDGQLDLSPLQA